MSEAKTHEELLSEVSLLHAKLKIAEEAERTAWEGQTAMAHLADNLPGMAYRLVYEGGEAGRIEYLSAGTAELTGYDSGRIIRDRHLFERSIVHPEDVEARRNIIRGAMERRENYELTYRLLTGNGTAKWVAERGLCLYDESGKVLAREGFVHDIGCPTAPTSHLQEEAGVLRGQLEAARLENECAERQRQAMQRSLRQSQRLESLGSLALGLAHDFNNILQAILGYGQMALGEVPQDGAAKKHVDRILGSAQRACGLTMRLLTFCGEGEPSPESQYVEPLLGDAVRMLRSVLPATVKLETDVFPEPGMIHGDATLILQVFVTLATVVSRQLGTTGGTLEFHVGEAYVDGDNALGVRQGTYTGITIGEHHSVVESGDRADSRQVTPQIERDQPGLAVVRDILGEMGGALSIRPCPDGRHVFRVYLPVCEEPADDTVAPSTGRGGPGSLDDFPSKGEHVLFIDDEQILVDLGTLVCEELGYRVTACASSTDALRLFEDDPASFDVVLTDQTMPDLTGFELSQQILSIRPDIPIILTTGYSEMVDEVRAREIGIREYLMKPMTPEGLAAVLRRVFEA